MLKALIADFGHLRPVFFWPERQGDGENGNWTSGDDIVSAQAEPFRTILTTGIEELEIKNMLEV